MHMIHTIQYIYIIYISELDFKCTPTSFILVKTQFIQLIDLIFIDLIINVLMCFISCNKIFFLVFCRMISSTACWTISFNSCFFPIFLLDVGSFLIYLKEPTVAYLVLKYFISLHSSDECPKPWIIQVSLYISLGGYTYLWLRLPESLPIME